MSQLSDVEKYYITGHRDIDYKVLAKKLDVPANAVKNYVAYLDNLDKIEVKKKKKEETSHKKEIKPLTAYDLMAKKEKRGVVIMTSEASQIGDEIRKQNKMSPKLAKNVKKIRPESDETV